MSQDLSVLHVVGARPNFMKIAPLLRILDSRPGYRNVLVHTGQHYDHTLSDSIIRDLRLMAPDYNLGVGSGSHAVQTAGVMTAFESVLEAEEPHLVIVVGDVNSTLAAALTASKMGVPVAHVEAGLRSRDREMPEEINRTLTDRLSEVLLTPSREAGENLIDEGIEPGRIHFVGNIMIDSLQACLPRARERTAWVSFGVERGAFALMTLHRPSNVDDRDQLAEIFAAVETIARDMPVVFPMHPRTRDRTTEFGLSLDGVIVCEPVGYLDLLSLMDGAAVVLTDSGGVQEETTVLGTPCLTLRSSTERPVTIREGTNRLVPIRSREAVVDAWRSVVADPPSGGVPELWDGKTAPRIASVLDGWWSGRSGFRMPKGPGLMIEGGEAPLA